MSVLVVGARGDAGKAVVARLVDQGDDVRVIEPDETAAARWRALGAFVARGTPDDADLVERAAQSVRTVIVLGAADLGPVVTGAAAAGVGRLVVCVRRRDEVDPAALSPEVVALLIPATRVTRRPAISAERLAEAIDAADDLAGAPRMVVDLGASEGWRRLGLQSP